MASGGDQPYLEPLARGDPFEVRVGGVWVVETAAASHAQTERLLKQAEPAQLVILHCDSLTRLDTSGAWLLQQLVYRLRAEGIQVEFDGLRPDQEQFLREVSESVPAGSEGEVPARRRRPRDALVPVVALGAGTLAGLRHVGDALHFLVQILETAVGTLLRPQHLRVSAVVAQMQRAGVNAIPVVALLAFLISIVLAYQGAAQLDRFGAGIYTVNLTVVSLLREMGVLLTSVLVAGRSGSAFAAEIGTMKVNEELDAMATMELDPFEVLVWPRILALVIMLPLLTVLADLVGLVGGALSAYMLLGMPWDAYLLQARSALTPWTFWVGVMKAPVFAFLIASVGTFWGMRVAGSAESVGRATTVAVVHAIFLVIAADAVFSLVFGYLGI